MTSEVDLWTSHICAHTYIQIFTHMCTNMYMFRQHYIIFILIKKHYPNKTKCPPGQYDVNSTYMWALSHQIVCEATNMSRYYMSINTTTNKKK